MRRPFLLVLGLLLTATTVAAAGLTELVVPQYMEAANSSTRLPGVFRVTLTGLTPNATYRYWPGAVLATDAATTNGAGNPLFVDDAYTFYSTSTGMGTPGSTCSQLTTDAAGSYTGWMGVVGTGNARFTAGNVVYLRVMLNDGAGGSSVVTRLTSTSGVQLIAFGASATEGTGVYQLDGFAPRDVVLLYDNFGGAGRPLATAFVQNEGATVASAVPYYSALDGTAGAWGALVPNNLAAGIRRIEVRTYANGEVAQWLVDFDGVWNPGAVGTVNPAGGVNAIDLTGVRSEDAVPTRYTTIGRLKSLYR